MWQNHMQPMIYKSYGYDITHLSRNNKSSYSQKQKAIQMQNFKLAKRKASDTKQDDTPKIK